MTQQQTMTTIYFVRHAQSDNSVRDGRIRPLTEKGMNDRVFVTGFLQDKDIDIVLSSPFKRAVDMVAEFAEQNNFAIETIEDFRERKSDHDMRKSHADFVPFMAKQWEDFNYTYSDGEYLADVQNRNISALTDALIKHRGQNIVIGTHGTALSTIINYYDCAFGFEAFMEMVNILPWIVKMTFDGNTCSRIEMIDILERSRNE